MTPDAAPRRDRQVVRMLGIAKALAEGGRVTLSDLATRFRTTRQSIYRDLHALEAIGIPVVGDDRGRYAGVLRLAAGFQPSLPAAPLTRQEVLAVAWSAKEAGGRGHPFPEALSMALLKLQALVDRRSADVVTALDGTMSGNDRGMKDSSAHQAALLRLVEAIITRRRCLVAYQASGRERPNRFPYDPYRLRSVQGGVYSLGRVPAYPKDLSTLALERIRALDR